MIHELKTWPEPFQAVWTGEKRFEYRLDDRSFQVNDMLVLREHDPDKPGYTGRDLIAEVIYVLRGGRFGIPEGYVIMTIVVTGRSHSDPLRAAAEMGAKWMEWWLNSQECECEGGGHNCGYNERWRELRQIKEALNGDK